MKAVFYPPPSTEYLYMTRKDIAQKLVEAMPEEFSSKRNTQLSFEFTPPESKGIKKADKYLQVILNQIKQTLLYGENVEISGFGKFMVRKKNERIGRNPKTKKEALINARKVITFKPSHRFKTAINNGSG